LAFRVNADDFHLHRIAYFENFARVGDMLPRQFGEVYQTFGPANIDKSAEIDQADHATCTLFADLQVLNQIFLATLAHFAGGGTLGQDQPVAAAIHFHNLDGNGRVDHLAPALFRSLAFHRGTAFSPNLALRHEAAHTPKAHNQAAFVIASHAALVDLLLHTILLCQLP